jgi:hypothetical protein
MQGPQAVTICQAAFERLTTPLVEIKSAPQIQRALLMFLNWWTGESDIDATRFTLPIQHVIDLQLCLGWDQFERGHILTKWQYIQTYFKDLKV